MAKTLAALLSAAAMMLQSAAAQPRYTELDPPQQVESTDKIQVVEFFWYGCIHCYNIEPYIESWLKKLPPDVEFKRIPAVFNQRWSHDAAVFYTLEAMNLLDKLHRPLFDAIHRDRLRTDDPAAFGGWLQKHGVDPKRFMDTMKSFGVQSRTRRATQQTGAYKINGTPAMAVHGRYTVSADEGGTQQGMLQTVDYLINTMRRR